MAYSQGYGSRGQYGYRSSYKSGYPYRSRRRYSRSYLSSTRSLGASKYASYAKAMRRHSNGQKAVLTGALGLVSLFTWHIAAILVASGVTVALAALERFINSGGASLKDAKAGRSLIESVEFVEVNDPNLVNYIKVFSRGAKLIKASLRKFDSIVKTLKESTRDLDTLSSEIVILLDEIETNLLTVQQDYVMASGDADFETYQAAIEDVQRKIDGDLLPALEIYVDTLTGVVEMSRAWRKMPETGAAQLAQEGRSRLQAFTRRFVS